MIEVTGVTKEDLAKAQTLQNILKNARLDNLPVTECVGIGETITWFRDLCISLGKGFQKSVNPVAPSSTPTPPSDPKEESGGLNVKEYHPGDLSGASSKKGKK